VVSTTRPAKPANDLKAARIRDDENEFVEAMRAHVLEAFKHDARVQQR
jgi:hypothetical protein